MDMFCFQCQETARNEGCDVRGVCGKFPDIAALQDMLLYMLKGMAISATRARAIGVTDSQVDRFVPQALFATVTNVSFDPDRFVSIIHTTCTLRDALKEKFLVAYQQANGCPFTDALPEIETWNAHGSTDELIRKGEQVGIQTAAHPNEDIRSLRELLIYGLKGLAAYADHAYLLDYEQADLLVFFQEGLAATANDDLTVDDLFKLALRCGEQGVAAMALLDKANTDTYGHPEPTHVNIGVTDGPGILISGHDLRDLDELLQQSQGTGVKIYTHGEMLPAHAYPAFKKYDHLVGNYGGAWWQQRQDFQHFNGPIVMTTNCIQDPHPSYQDKIFTTGHVGWPGLSHIADREPNNQKDFSAVIQKAQTCAPPVEMEQGKIPIGFAHQTVLSVADKVVEAVKSGNIKRFVVMAGCDGRQSSRSYYTEVAEGLPNDAIILTAGCAKYRYNKLPLGEIAGIPRVLDAGQCNDCYSLVVVAQKLAEVFGVANINDLPISYDIAWYEQKAVLVLLSLLALGVKGIRLGPTLPAFLSPNVQDVLVKTFDIKPIGTVEQDIQAIMVGA